MEQFFQEWEKEPKPVPLGLKVRIGRLAKSLKSENGFFKTVKSYSEGMDSKTVFLNFSTGEHIARCVNLWRSAVSTKYFFVKPKGQSE